MLSRRGLKLASTIALALSILVVPAIAATSCSQVAGRGGPPPGQRRGYRVVSLTGTAFRQHSDGVLKDQASLDLRVEVTATRGNILVLNVVEGTLTIGDKEYAVTRAAGLYSTPKHGGLIRGTAGDGEAYLVLRWVDGGPYHEDEVDQRTKGILMRMRGFLEETSNTWWLVIQAYRERVA